MVNKKIILRLVMVLAVFSAAYAGELVEKEAFVYNDEGRRDPFWPLISPSGAIITSDEEELSTSDMMLTGVMTGSDGKNVAVINGKIVKEGDTIGAFKVERISPTYVVLDRGQEKSELHLRKEE